MSAKNRFAVVLDRLIRVLYILMFLFTGGWALFIPDHYAEGMDTVLNTPVGRGEIQAIGAVYLLSGLVVLFCWVKSRSADLYKTVAFVVGAILLSRGLSLVRGEFDQLLLILVLIEVPLFIWAVLNLRAIGRINPAAGS